ncbi:MAG: polysulfide reductase NrfD [Anaerolineae bacterium]|nr:polysulfide reductase NrfD [Anaerolineae bacterium]
MSHLETTVFAPLRKTGIGFYILFVALAALVAWGTFAYIYQLIEGLGVTGLSRPVYWGIYLTNFVFFIGISHAGTLISAILRVTFANWRRSITRIAEAVTVFALCVGALQILIDLGRPERILNMVFFGRYQSPFLWDLTCISIYLLSSVTYLYLPMIPDFARMRDKLTDVAGWRKWLYRVAALGWQGTHEQHRRLEIAITIMAIAIIPIAVSVHTVVSWIFGMTVQPMWHSTIFGPYFVVGAIFSGIATLFIAMAIMRKVLHLEPWLTDKQFNYLGILLLVMSAFWCYFTFAEYLTTIYGALTHEMHVADAKLYGEYNWAFWAMVFCNAIVPFAILTRRSGRTVKGTVIASIFVDIGMWLERFTIVAPTLTRPSLAFEHAIYQPTWVEISITIGSLALFALLFVIFFKLFPSMAIWEVEEGIEIEERKRITEKLSLEELRALEKAS